MFRGSERHREGGGWERLKARYLEFAIYLRSQMEKRDLSVRQLAMLLEEKVPRISIYHWLYGNSIPEPWQLRLLEQRLRIETPWRYLRGEDRFGVPKKSRQLDLPGLREAKR